MSAFTSKHFPAVAVNALHKRYPNGTAANGSIDLTVNRGEAVSILGPNGAGKTTFLRQITTELKPTSGSIEVFGVDAVRRPGDAKSLMGITPQEAGLFDTLTVDEHLEYFGRLKGLSRSESRMETRRLTAALDLEESGNKRVGELSIGQKRRVLIGLALMGEPPLLILDEPTTGLDPASRRTVWRLLRKVAESGTTLIFSTHYIEEAENISSRAVFFNRGNIVAAGSLGELRQTFPHRYCMTLTDGGSGQKTVFFQTFSEVQDYLKVAGPAEYQLKTSTLEDVYFSLVGDLPDEEKGNGGA